MVGKCSGKYENTFWSVLICVLPSYLKKEGMSLLIQLLRASVAIYRFG